MDDTTIVIECNLIGIKRDFLNHELSNSSVCTFSKHSMAELFETSNCKTRDIPISGKMVKL